jgi:DNA-binding response OmpR family regulator
VRVLIVEDEAPIAKAIRETVSLAGHAVAAVVPSVTAALAFLRADSCDAAILDVNLRGESVEPVAAELVLRQIPFLGLTGYGAGHHPPSFRGCVVIAKPFDIDVLDQALSALASPAK